MGTVRKIMPGMCAGMCVFIISGSIVADQVRSARPAAWAEPLFRDGLPNFHRVSDRLCRGARPEPKGFVELQKPGVRTVVNLRSFHSNAMMLSGSSL